MCINIYTCVYIHRYVHIYIYMICICIYSCVYTHLYVHIYIYGGQFRELSASRYEFVCHVYLIPANVFRFRHFVRRNFIVCRIPSLLQGSFAKETQNFHTHSVNTQIYTPSKHILEYPAHAKKHRHFLFHTHTRTRTRTHTKTHTHTQTHTHTHKHITHTHVYTLNSKS